MKEIVSFNWFSLRQFGINGLKVNDLAILDLFLDSITIGSLDHAIIDGRDYWKFPYSLVLSELPLLGNPSEKTLKRCFSRLCKADVFYRCSGNTALQSVFIGLGDMGKNLLEADYCSLGNHGKPRTSISISFSDIHVSAAKARLFERDGHKCLKCGSLEWLTTDHVLPRSRGGRNDMINLQTLCFTCNMNKGDNYCDYRAEPPDVEELYIVRSAVDSAGKIKTNFNI
jgi:hypothetical protein